MLDSAVVCVYTARQQGQLLDEACSGTMNMRRLCGLLAWNVAGALCGVYPLRGRLESRVQSSSAYHHSLSGHACTHIYKRMGSDSVP
jgi:hypothetical protein